MPIACGECWVDAGTLYGQGTGLCGKGTSGGCWALVMQPGVACRNFLAAIMEGGAHGRLMKHDLTTGATTVLARSLAFPNGVALSQDRSFLVFCETTLMRYAAGSPARAVYVT